eukprot:TRINITY_DN74027_c0_g1_i1.p1 TRINITY_DN74027_c0_g1~~TRINITY_DN74027_c0_g1_i1.p1  ORF type:complete len:363 (+),score=49.00 TRINITY_DN74027_c0_g1_i1:152-1240(+)
MYPPTGWSEAANAQSHVGVPCKTVAGADLVGRAQQFAKGMVDGLYSYTFQNASECAVQLLMEGSLEASATGGNPQTVPRNLGGPGPVPQELTLYPGQQQRHDSKETMLYYTAAFVQPGKFKVFRRRVPIEAGSSVTIQSHHLRTSQAPFLDAVCLRQALDMSAAFPQAAGEASLGMYGSPSAPNGAAPGGYSAHAGQAPWPAGGALSTGAQQYGTSASPPAVPGQGPPMQLGGGMPPGQELQRVNTYAAQTQPAGAPVVANATLGAASLPPGFVPVTGSVLCYSMTHQQWMPARVIGLAVTSTDHDAGSIFISYDGSGDTKAVRPQDFPKVIHEVPPAPANMVGNMCKTTAFPIPSVAAPAR